VKTTSFTTHKLHSSILETSPDERRDVGDRADATLKVLLKGLGYHASSLMGVRASSKSSRHTVDCSKTVHEWSEFIVRIETV